MCGCVTTAELCVTSGLVSCSGFGLERTEIDPAAMDSALSRLSSAMKADFGGGLKLRLNARRGSPSESESDDESDSLSCVVKKTAR